MKNIQEILLKCDGIGKLILGDEEIQISVTDVKSKLHNLDRYRNACGEMEGGDSIINTSLEVMLCENDFCRAEIKKNKQESSLFGEE